MLSRNDKDRSQSFPAIVRMILALRPATLLLDREVIALDRNKISRFQLLQGGTGRARYAVFDCLYLNGRDLTCQTLSTRRAALEKLISERDELILSHRLARKGFDAFRIAKKRGFEALVAKRLESLYIEGRSRDWSKVKVNQEDEFIIVGYTEARGSRESFGALFLGAYKARKLLYVGKVGTGFNRNNLASLYHKFQPLKRKTPAAEDLPHGTFLSPKLVTQISYTELTKDGRLRHRVYLGLRDDKDAKDVVLPEIDRLAGK